MPPPQNQFSHELLKQPDPNLKYHTQRQKELVRETFGQQTVQNDLDLQQLYYLQFLEEGGDLDDHDKSQESFEGNSIDQFIR